MPVHLKLFNAVLSSGTMPQTWCGGLITPIFKSGTKNDPLNYRGICISSCLGKLYCSILRDGPLFFWRKGMKNPEKNCLQNQKSPNKLFADMKKKK